MLTKLHIQNFKSLKEVTLDLQPVNLLIGPNNSGKTNLLKAVEFFMNQRKNIIKSIDLNRILYSNRRGLSFGINYNTAKKNFYSYKVDCGFPTSNDYAEFLGISEEEVTASFDYNDLDIIFEKFRGFEFSVSHSLLSSDTLRTKRVLPVADKTNYRLIKKLDSFLAVGKPWGIGEVLENGIFDIDEQYVVDRLFIEFFKNITIYRPEPATFLKLVSLEATDVLLPNCSNIITFLYTLSTNNKRIFKELENNFARCVGDLVELSTPPVNTEEGGKLSLKFFDRFGVDYWASEVSEGVLYFLALLCIIHQPNPPKLLLLEEPERGIHPRRIKEVMDFIFNLSQSKGIQVIMTSHHPYVLNEFEDMPEAVFVFDKDDEGATQVRNLQKDIIAPSNEENDKQGLPRIKFTQDLAEHWFSGFLGGVPA
ncbi:MAG: AAA family ATPase [Bacteroidetes bacterium]|nr:AAA family ATPase [Bacteroidota bacterium]